jgi:hypothetical protein
MNSRSRSLLSRHVSLKSPRSARIDAARRLAAVDLDRSLPPHLGPIKAGTTGSDACGRTRADRNAGKYSA